MTTTEKALAVASVALLAFAGLVGEALGRSRAEGDALDRSLAMVRVEVARTWGLLAEPIVHAVRLLGSFVTHE